MEKDWQNEILNYISGVFKRGKIDSFLDLGCGNGTDLKFFKEHLARNEDSEFVGIDKVEKYLGGAGKNYLEDGLKFYLMDAAKGFDFKNESFDAVYSMNVVECIEDKVKLVGEIHRILKPFAQVVCCHCDWDSIIYNGADKLLIKEVMHKYSNWKQPWMDSADSWMGRRLWGMFNSTGLFAGDVRIYNHIETEYTENSKGRDMVREIEYMVEAGIITRVEYNGFVENIEAAASNGSYLNVQPLYVYSGIKV